MRRTPLLFCLPISFVVLAVAAGGCEVVSPVKDLDDNGYGGHGAGGHAGGSSVGGASTSSGMGGMGECVETCGPCEYCATSDTCEVDATQVGQACGEVAVGSCDSLGACVTGAGIWAQRWGASDSSEGMVVVAVPGGVVIGGQFKKALSFGITPDLLNAGGGRDFFVAKVDDNGDATNVVSLLGGDDMLDNTLHGMATLADGEIAIGGTFDGVLETMSSDKKDGILVKLDSDLVVQWSKAIGGLEDDFVLGVASAPVPGEVVAVGSFEGMAFLDGAKTATARDGFVAGYAKDDGTAKWGFQFGGDGDEEAMGVAVNASGEVIVVGWYTGMPTFGSGALGDTGAQSSVFVAKLDESGNLSWAKGFGSGSGAQRPTAVAIDPISQDIVVVGRFQGDVVVGDDTVSNPEAKDDVFVLRLASDGSEQWVKALSGPGEDTAHAVAVDAAGNVVVVGQFENDLQCDITTLMCTGQPDAFVSKLASDGSPLWAYGDGGERLDAAHGVAIGSAGEVYLVGEIASDFTGFAGLSTSGHTMVGEDDSDVFLLKLNP